MKLISSKKTKRQIALLFVFAFMLSNVLSLIGPSAKAAVTITAPSTGTCFQHTGTTLSGALVTVYNIGTIQISLTAAEITPGVDAAAVTTADGAVSQATLAGSISTAGDVIGNVFSIVPPTGTNFVVVPGFESTAANGTNLLASTNATISNAVSNDSTGSSDSVLSIQAGVVTTGTAGIGRAIVAIARDAGASEVYPKTGTTTNTATISLAGLGIAIPPSGDGSLSGTLAATLDSTPPSGIGASGGAGTPAVAAAVPGLTGTINLCTITSPAGQLEAVLDSDDDTNDLYDKNTSQANLLALSQVGANTTVAVSDTTTVPASALLDLEPILIRGTTGTGSATRDQVFATGELLSTVDTAAEAAGAGGVTLVDVTTTFGNSAIAPITIAFSDDNATANASLTAVDIIISSSTAAASPARAGFAAAQTSRHGFLGALRAATIETNNANTNAGFTGGTTWGVASIQNSGGSIVVQESALASNDTAGIAGFGSSAANATEPFYNNFVDLRLRCDGTAPISGWFAVINSSTTAAGITTSTQGIVQSQAGTKFLVSSLSNFYSQALTNIAGTTPGLSTINLPFTAGRAGSAADSTVAGNALLYAACSNNALTIFPIQNGFDATRDIIAVSPRFSVTNISNTLASDTNIIAQVSGNNLSGTTTLNLTKILGAITSSGGQTSTLASAKGVGVSETGQLGIDCSSGSTSSVVLPTVSATSINTSISGACTSGSTAAVPSLYKGGASSSVSGSTVIDGSPVVQGNARGILITESTATGFSELVNKVGGGVTGTVFEVQLPSGCDVIDDQNDNNTAVSTTANTPGNDVTRVSIVNTAGITTSFAAGTTPADVTAATALVPATGADPASIHFVLTAAPGTGVDATTTDAILVKLDAQDIFCPASKADGALTGLVRAQNKTATPTITENLGTVSFGTLGSAATFAFADDVATSTKGEVSTNTNIGATARLSGGGVTTSNPFKITELDSTAFPIGGRVSARNLDPDNTVLSSVITRGQIWVVPADSSVFSSAPAAADISFSDASLVIDGTPYIATSATVDPNAPLGTLVIGVKQGTGNAAANTTTVTVKNLKLTGATSSTTDLVSTVQFYSQDAGVVINTPGVASGNSASTPTVFTPYVRGGTKANSQLNTAGVQLGTGSLSNQLLTSRLTTLGAPQISPFASLITSAKNADATKITVSSAAVATSSGSTSTDNVVTVTGAAGAVDGGAQVVISTGSTTYDSVTVFASKDGSFTAKLRGDCASPNTSVSVTVAEKIGTTTTTSVAKTALCNGSTGATEDSVFAEIAGADGTATITEVLAYITSKGGLSSIISAGGATLSGVIKAAKAALGLT